MAMSDLVERLRESAKGWEIEAADEIERLQLELKYKLDQSERIKNLEAEIERLQRDNKWLGELRDQLYSDKALLTALRKEDREDMQRLSDQADYLSDESAKLQAALTRIATMPPVNEEFGYQGYDADKMAAIARDALEDEKCGRS